ncbi:hypothetical protein CW736_06185 [Nonlabens sp. MB-3u-79]|uniref:lysylphosphatidylglycerol synthase domain-containing protein n=1 Tax=Nonlabens sp. MB-3u-79 TaxID=2058134 RepID=UPI000C30C8B6|nr:lysylphosphatidylglycerol synthase domain-containing protein [Nonlabens sp. MB-3u-79]AUC79010.1 hypothetical protein CW736_06185 [Nonlabens sp. MB-3u-79]
MSIALHKSKQFLAPLIKIIVILICAYVLYMQWMERPLQLNELWIALQKLPGLTLVAMIAISLASWLVESKKWQYLLDDFYKLSFRESVLQNLTAQAASFITPWRAGEFAMKSLFFKKTLRKKVLSRILAGTISQMLVTILLGVIGVLFYVKESLDLDTAFYLIGMGILLLLLMASISLWLIKKWKSGSLTTKKWRRTILFSLLRYLIFASNWLLLLWLLDYESSMLITIRNVSVFYLVVSIIPVFQVFDIAVKWTAATYIFEGGFFHPELIIVATTIIWLTNSILPTLLGCALLPFQQLKTLEE